MFDSNKRTNSMQPLLLFKMSHDAKDFSRNKGKYK